jgi:tetratricopeptide (TPR) repeat protein
MRTALATVVAVSLLLSPFGRAALAANTGPAADPAPAATGGAVTPESRFNEGESFARSGMWKEAESAYLAATMLRGTYPEAWNGLGHALKMQRRYPEALKAYERALTLRPDFPQALEYLGQTYVAMGRLEDARAALAKLRPLDAGLARKLEGAIDDGKPALGW